MKRSFTALAAVLAVALSLAVQAPASESAVVKSIGFIKTGTGLEVTVQIDGVYALETSVLTKPDRLVLDISPAEKLAALPSYEVNAFGVTAIRTGQFKPRVSRVILDFSGPVPEYDIQKTVTGLMIKVAGEAQAAEKAAEPAAVEPVGEARPAEDAKPAPKGAVRTTRPEAEPAAAGSRPLFFNTTVGVMAGSYKNDSDRFSEVYGGDTSFQFGLNFTRALVYFRGLHLDVSGEARMISKTGRATLSGDEAKIRIFPLTLAAILAYDMKYVSPFVGYGGDWFSYKETSALAETSGWASGDHFQGGLFIGVPGMENLRIKLYYKHTRVTATENEIDVKLGGSEFGFGVSYGFDFQKNALLVF
jgi:opacity protein-like surface antigen